MAAHHALIVWPKAVRLTRECYRLADTLPRFEEGGLKSQIRCAVVSICNNIAEGNASASRGEYRRYLGIARASANEARASVTLCVELGFLSDTEAATVLALADEVSRLLWSMRKGLEKGGNREQGTGSGE